MGQDVILDVQQDSLDLILQDLNLVFQISYPIFNCHIFLTQITLSPHLDLTHRTYAG